MIRAIAILLLMAVNGWSAEFLIAARNNWMVDADKTGWTAEQIAEADRQYKTGDIVEVFPDGKLSDYATAGGAFYVVRVTGLAYATALKYQEQLNDADGRMVSRRIYRIRAEDLRTTVKKKLKSTGVFNTTLSAVRTYIRNKVAGINE